MGSYELRRRLKEVDPDLRIIPGGARRRNHQSGNEQWAAAAGVVCSNCNREVYRSRDGLCMPCWEDMKDKELEVRDTTGITNWLPMDIIQQITHPARKKE